MKNSRINKNEHNMPLKLTAKTLSSSDSALPTSICMWKCGAAA